MPRWRSNLLATDTHRCSVIHRGRSSPNETMQQGWHLFRISNGRRKGWWDGSPVLWDWLTSTALCRSTSCCRRCEPDQCRCAVASKIRILKEAFGITDARSSHTEDALTAWTWRSARAAVVVASNASASSASALVRIVWAEEFFSLSPHPGQHLSPSLTPLGRALRSLQR